MLEKVFQRSMFSGATLPWMSLLLLRGLPFKLLSLGDCVGTPSLAESDLEHSELLISSNLILKVVGLDMQVFFCCFNSVVDCEQLGHSEKKHIQLTL